ncbi:DUF1501 domain-containing protein [Thalassoroseus pseudoceratinae]|uniref:DUF1501 domain-containing protein n=1 Tax=Thalassoroseus pseudoceratinae TaxID=2713176 RepID=UPI00141DE681|nr:DUF1501 domain-containing protein [Thalassoroseus pseudoceratinae]
MAKHLNCDGLRRRDFLKAGVLGTTGLSLASYLRMAEAGGVRGNAPAKSAIFINLNGGPSHMDTFDLKPNAPDEYRGLFNPIATNASGVEFCEHLPKLAKCADKFAVLRGVSHTLGAHQLGTEYVNTGNRPLPSLEFPGYGSVVTKQSKNLPGDLPSFVAVGNNTQQKAGYMGVRYAPLVTGSTPRPGQPYSVRGVSLGNGLTVNEVEKRTSLLRELDTTFAGYEKNNQLLDGLDRFSEQAHNMITSKRAREAFDISKESPAFAAPFGDEAFGMSCLLASRLVEAGVKFVSMSLGGWDTHQNNFDRLENNLLPTLDTGLAALFNGLAQKGLLDSTVVYITGEFGRTPKLNNRSTPGGRDHYPRCMFMLMAGGGVKGGQVIGESDEKATQPLNDVITPDDVAASFYHALGIDHTHEYDTTTGRPVMIVREGTVIDQLFA